MSEASSNKRSLDAEEGEESSKRSKNDDSSSGSSSEDESSSDSSSSDSSGSSSDSESESETLRVCPLRSLVEKASAESISYSPDLQPENNGQESGRPVDPVFVDCEESSGEAVVSAADVEDMEMMLPPLPSTNPKVELQPPLPEENVQEPPAQPLSEQPLNVAQHSAQPLAQNLEESDQPMTQLCPLKNKVGNLEGQNQNDDEAMNQAPMFESDSEESLAQDELDALLEKDVEDLKKDDNAASAVIEHTERTRFRLVDKGKNHFDVLPNGWVVVDHVSGMPIYLHRPTRSVTLSKPYHLGTASARRHPIPLNAIPCLNYKKALEEEEAVKQKQDSIFPYVKVESVEETMKKASLNPEEYRDYCQKLFLFKKQTVKKYRSWAERRTHQRQERDQTIKEIKENNKNDQENPTENRPALPEGTKIISIPVFELETEEGKNPEENNPLRQKIVRKSKKDWVLNPAGKSTVCILHEYLQHSVKKAPEYRYQEMESSATPYSAVVVINGIEYGRGVGSSKKEAKSEAARLTLEILIPEFKNHLVAKNGYVTKEAVDLSFFEDIRIEDPRVPELCNKMSEPSPYSILLNCLQRNYGLGDTNIKTDLTPARNRKYNRYLMTVNEKTVEVTCRSKKDGKQIASQKLLQLLHPNIKSWGSLLKMYGSRAITAQKNKKERESEVTGLQTQNGSGHTSPNVAILAKLREEMQILAERKKSFQPLGKLMNSANNMEQRINL